MDDLISREEAVKAVDEAFRMGDCYCDQWAIRSLLNGLPSAEPERKRGKWIKQYWNGEYTRKCSACNITQTVTTYRGKVNFNYCPYCGAEMTKGEE